MWRDLQLRLETTPGSDIDNVAIQLMYIASLLKIRVITDFNGKEIHANGSGSKEYERIMRDYWKDKK